MGNVWEIALGEGIVVLTKANRVTARSHQALCSLDSDLVTTNFPDPGKWTCEAVAQTFRDLYATWHVGSFSLYSFSLGITEFPALLKETQNL